ncbi:hypothetical protein GE115_08830 [Agromyces sp. CFH 90414]|uniref:Uncharacterized protein n=1 Tax=Agromyces agglutinans TaxID=2662258 RepID=A0A6I2F6N1_9MICO|nr:hypothetical protein [Agromyces agglutinans]MRG59971.1 hypothetical protein [Agromyces agglutinans]
MAGFLAGRRRGAPQHEVHDADVARRAASALLAADEHIRLATDDLGFAEAELGPEATARLTHALAAARRVLRDAFRLNRLNLDAQPTAPDLVRARNARIVRACEWIEEILDHEASALADQVARVRRGAPPDAPVAADPFANEAYWPVLDDEQVETDASPHAAHTNSPHRMPLPSVVHIHVHLHQMIEAADRRLDIARDAVAAHPGRVGPAALACLAESEHLRRVLAHSLGQPLDGDVDGRAATIVVVEPDHRERVLALAQRVAGLANEAAELARRDLREPLPVERLGD